MNTNELLNQILESGKELLAKGQDIAETKLGIPQSGENRDAMLSGMSKGAAAAGLLAILLGTSGGRKLTGAALKLGSLAAIGGVAYKTFQKWQAEQGGAVASSQPVDQLTGPASEQRGHALLRALIAAAKADGHIDDSEQAIINDHIQKLQLDPAALELVKQEISRPLSAKDVAEGVDSPMTAAEIYLISLVVIDTANELERAYLKDLAEHLKLTPTQVAELESQVTSA